MTFASGSVRLGDRDDAPGSGASDSETVTVSVWAPGSCLGLAPTQRPVTVTLIAREPDCDSYRESDRLERRSHGAAAAAVTVYRNVDPPRQRLERGPRPHRAGQAIACLRHYPGGCNGRKKKKKFTAYKLILLYRYLICC